jgi:flagellar basal body-associated protein FliL
MKKLRGKKLLLLLPVLLLVVGAAYKMVLAPKPKPVAKKIAGAVVPLQKEFLLNLNGGRYAKVSVALVIPGPPPPAAESTTGLPQEAAVRAVVTDELTGLNASELVVRGERHLLLERIRKAIDRTTDEDVQKVLFTDITVQ